MASVFTADAPSLSLRSDHAGRSPGSLHTSPYMAYASSDLKFSVETAQLSDDGGHT